MRGLNNHKVKRNCTSCDSTFTIIYDDEDVIGDPMNCPFCGTEVDLEEVENLAAKKKL